MEMKIKSIQKMKKNEYLVDIFIDEHYGSRQVLFFILDGENGLVCGNFEIEFQKETESNNWYYGYILSEIFDFHAKHS